MAEKTTNEEINEEATDETTPLEVFIDHQRKAATEAGKALEGLIPTAIREHGSSAFKEMVEGYRQLFNAAMDQVIDNIERIKVDRSKEEKE